MRQSTFQHLVRAFSLLLVVAPGVLLVGCGGGGGGDSTPVTPVPVTPAPVTYTISGSVTGLVGTLVLQNNGGDDLPVTADGPFTFLTAVNSGASYDVTVKTNPTGLQCSVVAGSGTATADMTGIDVQCLAPVALDARALSTSVELSWSDVGATSYNLYYSTDPTCDVTSGNSCATLVGSINSAYSTTSPYQVTGLTNGQYYSFWLQATYPSGHVTLSESGARPDRLATDGPVRAIAAASDGTVYLGGDFTQVGAATGSGVSLRTDSVGTYPFPVVDGEVKATASDGAGGWYIGGYFAHVGGVSRNNLAHILADGSVGPWNPNTNGAVYALVVSGSTIYVGGHFSTVGTSPHNNLAAIDANPNDATYGKSLDNWTPDTDRAVNALAVSGSTLYVGGHFSTVGGLSRISLAAVDINTADTNYGAPLASWVSNVAPSTGQVYALAVSGSTLYVGGDFTSIGAAGISYLAAVKTTDGTPVNWNPQVNNQVYALAVSDSTVYIGGDFDTVLGSETRNHLAAFNISDGALDNWSPAVNIGSTVYALAVSGSTVYAGGWFNSINGAPRNHLAAIDTSGTLESWAPATNDIVEAIAVSGSAVYAGGSFTTIGSVTRNHLAAVDSTTGTLDNWDPDANGTVNALVLSGNGSTVYAGGAFTTINGANQGYLAAIDTSTGTPNGWNPNANGAVNALALSNDGSTVYAGGAFTTINGTGQSYLAAIDSTSGTPNSWPSANAVVNALAVSGSTVYAGGAFTMINGSSYSYLAAIDTTTGAPIGTWTPSADGNVNALAVSGDGSTVYAGGKFTTINTINQSYLAAIDSTTGTLNSWPSANGVVNALAVSGSTVYAGGTFTTIGSTTLYNLAAIDTSTGTPNNTWNPNLYAYSSVFALAVDSSFVYAGGLIPLIGDQVAAGFAILPK